MSWSKLLADRPAAPFPIPAYSEFMPAPNVGVKPAGESDPFTPADEEGWNVSEFEEIGELRPGLTRIAQHVSDQLIKLAKGEPTQFSKTILRENPALPPDLRPPGTLILPVALSRTQDDKGNVRWTLFGSSHHGPARAFWRSVTPDAFQRIVGDPEARVSDEPDLPEFARKLLYDGSSKIRTLVTFRFFAELPPAVRTAYLEGTLRLVPSPESLIFWGHRGYRQLASELPWAMQVPLLHLFPHSERRYGIRIPQSGWLDEKADAKPHRIRRSHRWQRVERDVEDAGDPLLDDPVTVALFSREPDHLGLYGKPMARNSQIWTEDYRRLLDGPTAPAETVSKAAQAFRSGGRFGYRLLYPPMRVGSRSVFWHRPLVVTPEGIDLTLEGYLSAEPGEIDLRPRIRDRKPYLLAAEIADARTMRNVRKILEWRELLGEPLAPSFARQLLTAAKDLKLGEWIEKLPGGLPEEVRSRLGPEPPTAESRTFERTRTREFEERYWRTIESLCAYRGKNNGDSPCGLRELGDRLHQYYEKIGAGSFDHEFVWEREFDFPWLPRQERERNIAVVIPGRNRREAVIMADHYDTAYMEDLYYPSRGGNRTRTAAVGADDNHSATAALMLAAEILRDLPLERDVWLVHLTGEEFPADCLGARALARALIEKNFRLGGRDFSETRVVGAFVLDMVAHNHDRDLDTFQIAPGEGRGSAKLARIAHFANERWNRMTKVWNESPERRGRGRRVEEGIPLIAAHLPLIGEIRPEWDPKSSLYNTDGQIFSDVGIPVVLFMENYDINRSGYHDTHDTMKNIDLDYGAALVAIAIESVADAACTP